MTTPLNAPEGEKERKMKRLLKDAKRLGLSQEQAEQVAEHAFMYTVSARRALAELKRFDLIK